MDWKDKAKKLARESGAMPCLCGESPMAIRNLRTNVYRISSLVICSFGKCELSPDIEGKPGDIAEIVHKWNRTVRGNVMSIRYEKAVK